MSKLLHSRIAPVTLPAILLVCSVLLGAGSYVLWHSESKDGWSATPLFWLLTLAMTLLLCIAGDVALIVGRRESKVTWFDCAAFVVSVFAVVLGGFLLLMVVGSMRGMGII